MYRCILDATDPKSVLIVSCLWDVSKSLSCHWHCTFHKMSDDDLALVYLFGLSNFICKDSLRYPLSNAENRRSISIFLLELFKLHWPLLASKMMKKQFFDRQWSSFDCLLPAPLIKFSFHLTWFWCKIWQAFWICHRFFSILSPWRTRLEILVNFHDNFTGARTFVSVHARWGEGFESCYLACNAAFDALSIGGSPADNGPEMTEIKQKYWKGRFLAILTWDPWVLQMLMRISPFRSTTKS